MSITATKPEAVSRDKKDIELFCATLQEMDVVCQESKDEQGKPRREITLTILKEGPGNPKDKRYYTKNCVEGVNDLLYKRRKFFFNHLAEGAPPASDDIKNWAATLVDTWIVKESSAGIERKAKLRVHDNWLWERCLDDVARKEIAVSIEGRGQGRTDKINGQEYTVIESIFWLNGFKFVNYPGNATMGLDTVEQAKQPADKTQEDTIMDLKGLTLAELKEARPDLLDAIEKDLKVKVKVTLEEAAKTNGEAITKLREDFEGQIKSMAKTIETLNTKLEEADRKTDAAEIREKMRAKETLIEKYLRESKLPEEAKTPRFMTRLKAIVERENTNDKGEKVLVSVEEQIKAEVEEQLKLVKPELGALPNKTGNTTTTLTPKGKNAVLTEDEKQWLYDQRVFKIDEGMTLEAYRARRDKKEDPKPEPAKA